MAIIVIDVRQDITISKLVVFHVNVNELEAMEIFVMLKLGKIKHSNSK